MSALRRNNWENYNFCISTFNSSKFYALINLAKFSCTEIKLIISKIGVFNLSKVLNFRLATEREPITASPVWVVNKWSSCSKFCGRGNKTRTTQCRLGDLTLADTKCDKSKEPGTVSECYERECSSSKFSWDRKPFLLIII